MKKSKLFDIIIYRILFSIPVSCVANFVYGFALFLSFLARSMSSGNFVYILAVVAALAPFILFNIVRYIAIKSGKLRYGIVGLALSSIPEYLFFIIFILLEHISSL